MSQTFTIQSCTLKSTNPEAIDEVLKTRMPKSTIDTARVWVRMLKNFNDEKDFESDLKLARRRSSETCFANVTWV